MTLIIGQEKESLDDLTHHGVKGMKWGVRKAVNEVHNEKLNRSAAINERVAAGKGSFGDKARVVSGSSGGRLITRGVKGTAKKNAEEIRAHQQRINTGHAHVRDVLTVYGNLRPSDIAAVGLKVYQNQHGSLTGP